MRREELKEGESSREEKHGEQTMRERIMLCKWDSNNVLVTRMVIAIRRLSWNKGAIMEWISTRSSTMKTAKNQDDTERGTWGEGSWEREWGCLGLEVVRREDLRCTVPQIKKQCSMWKRTCLNLASEMELGEYEWEKWKSISFWGNFSKFICIDWNRDYNFFSLWVQDATGLLLLLRRCLVWEKWLIL